MKDSHAMLNSISKPSIPCDGCNERMTEDRGCPPIVFLTTVQLFQHFSVTVSNFFRTTIMHAYTDKAPSILFVCLGNYIRSPICEGLLRTLVGTAVVVDSAAVTHHDIGRHPHRHARAIATIHGFDISAHVARMVTQEDFDRFDVLASLEPSVQRTLAARKPAKCRGRIVEFVPGKTVYNPWSDPYSGFERMYAEVESGMRKFIAREIPKQFLR
jgi:protein-tyrosine phosphatase